MCGFVLSRFVLSTSTKCVRFSPTGLQFAAASTEGLLLYSLDDALIFDPAELGVLFGYAESFIGFVVAFSDLHSSFYRFRRSFFSTSPFAFAVVSIIAFRTLACAHWVSLAGSVGFNAFCLQTDLDVTPANIERSLANKEYARALLVRWQFISFCAPCRNLPLSSCCAP